MIGGGDVGGGGKAIFLDAVSAKQIGEYQGHSRPVLTVRFLDPQTVVSAGVDNTLRIWSVPDAKHLRTLDNHLVPSTIWHSPRVRIRNQSRSSVPPARIARYGSGSPASAV